MPTERKPRKAGDPPERPMYPRELVMVVRPGAGLRATREGMASATATDADSLTQLLKANSARLQPLFGLSEERLRHVSATVAVAAPMPDLSVYYRVEASDERLDDLAASLAKQDAVEAAYIKPPTEPAQGLNDMLPLAHDAPPATLDFTARQLYLDPAPGGIDARYAWMRAGGRGANVRIIDVEGAWRFSHEDLLLNQGGVIGGTQSTDSAWRNHGTAVVGVFGGDANGFGITGICPDANVRAVSIFNMGSSAAIRLAADALGPGDIILIELHRPGPRFNFQGRTDQRGYIAVEWWQDDFDAIRYAISRGVIVVEAGGNGAENLDDPIYSTRPSGFPPSWTNPFNRANCDSGAIVVGAGAPPPGTHGQNHGADRSRLDFSNWGALIDAQGWGREVTTTAYGDLQGGNNEDLWYTDSFSGTSSASPIIVGALGCLQGVLKAASKTPLTPAAARNILRSTGSPQQDEPTRPATQRIGNRPNLRQAIASLLPKLLKEKELKEKEIKEKDSKDVKDMKERTKERKEFKEIKEKDIKEFKDRKDVREHVKVVEITPEAAPAAMSLEQRLIRVEQAVAELSHFIGPALRPELGTSPLSREADQAESESELIALSEELAKQAADSKQLKDNKDIEKVREV
ncbi:MAG: S8 family peptidase [Syntrophobacter sp.]